MRPPRGCRCWRTLCGCSRRLRPSFDHAKALLEASVVLLDVEGRSQARITALNRALEIAEAADATALIPRILPEIAYDAFIRGQVEEGLAALERG